MDSLHHLLMVTDGVQKGLTSRKENLTAYFNYPGFVMLPALDRTMRIIHTELFPFFVHSGFRVYGT